MEPDQSEYITNDLLQILKCRQPNLLQSFSTNAQYIESNQTRGGVGQFLEGTTILALIYAAGVVIGGDRQATGGFQVGERYMRLIHIRLLLLQVLLVHVLIWLNFFKLRWSSTRKSKDLT